VKKYIWIASGPCFETPAEYRYLSTIGADVVGMSVVPEAIVAIHSGMKVLGFSVVTDMAFSKEKTTHEENLKVANEASEKLATLLKSTEWR